MPCVRVWDVAERTQVAEVQCHKYGGGVCIFLPQRKLYSVCGIPARRDSQRLGVEGGYQITAMDLRKYLTDIDF